MNRSHPSVLSAYVFIAIVLAVFVLPMVAADPYVGHAMLTGLVCGTIIGTLGLSLQWLRTPEYDRGGRECWQIMTPGGNWDTCLGVDKPGGMWTVTGEVPNITVTPSILINQGELREWHGFITNGELVTA